MTSTVQDYPCIPGGAGCTNNSTLESPYIFVIILSGSVLILIIILTIREILKSRGILQDCCNYKGNRIQCLSCEECCVGCIQICNCYGRTSFESCLDACCPKRGSIEPADIITCEACCSGQCCSCGGTACICAPTDVSNVNCLCCAFVQQYPRPDHDDE